MVPNNVSELTQENWVKSLWEEVRRADDSRDNKGKALIAKVDLDKKQARVDLVTKYADTEPNSLSINRALSMKDLPSVIKPEVNDKEILRIPSQYHSSLIVMGTADIQALMSTSIKVTLTFAELSKKVKPKLWHEITSCLGILPRKYGSS